MLEEKGLEYRYREYTKEPLDRDELVKVLGLLQVGPKALLRKNDRAYKENGLNGQESDETLIDFMVQFPTLLQRPIGVLGDKAVIGRPIENLLEL